jgi:hypothetical protein
MWTVLADSLGRSFMVVHSGGRAYLTKNLKHPKPRRFGSKEDAQALADGLNRDAARYQKQADTRNNIL